MPTVIEHRSHFDIPDWLVSYHNDWLRPDIIAGLTAATAVIPKSMAYARIASLPVQVGLCTAFLPMIIYALLGTSRVLSVSTMATLAILAASRLVEVVSNGSTDSLVTAGATPTLLVGVILTLAFLLKFGFVANFISQPTN
jgi:MFS superfamily sulfate permease-like transporter